MFKYIKEGGELYRLSFDPEYRSRIDRSAWWLFCVFAVVFLPHSFLSRFSNPFVIDILGRRTRNDYLYLLVNNPDFADAYIGGITLQIIILVIAMSIPLYLIFSAKEVSFFKESLAAYIAFLLTVIFSFFGAAYLLFGITDFGFNADAISWFQNNELKHNKWLPAPQSSITLIVTGLFLAGSTFPILGCAQLLKIVFSGKRVLSPTKKDARHG